MHYCITFQGEFDLTALKK